MSAQDDNTVSISVLGKEYLINCPEDARSELLASAKHLDKKMRDIRSGGKIIGLERMAIMAALNLSHELLQARTQVTSLEAKTRRLSDRIDQALADDQQLSSDD